MNPVIEARAVSKWFGEVVAVNNLEVAIDPGITGLLGPNGAGKSTFIKLALGLHAPSRGEIRVLGGAPRNNMDVLRRIGYCPEIDHFYENTTGYEFVYWLCRYWGMSGRAARNAAGEACDIVRMTGRMHDPIEEYSKGMRQRVKIAQAIACHPELLFPNRHAGLKGAAQATSPLDRGGVQRTLRQVATECGLKKRSPRTACATATPRT